MGYYANSEWYVTITGDIDALANDLKAQGFNDSWGKPEDLKEDSMDVVLGSLNNCNEDMGLEVSDDGRSIYGWGGGKMLSLAGENAFWATLSKHLTGTVDWVSQEGDGFWRVRLYGNGSFRDFPGTIVYPDDTDDTDTFTP